ncbi:30S ribosomal protein S8P [Acidilobus saccharovorans 345-15]|uniref:Small ribosomal subunit protein uS8 n=1 Tax=Acidilobus saccharovorans (strain DSM 16705 / JCM 18335 / VKM B-2471 / 345-15) TaxID=666510 RepID=D9PZZ2_ACIS3|nr:30S ribosomal protein S8 [Acidilobus saccharovorans]ADL18630.1 30S ribosomal protein S8P [Acidilobus saccharovorans 345-15]
MVHDTLSAHLSAIYNAELRGQREVILMPASKLTVSVLKVLQKEGYIGDFEYIDDGRWGKFRVTLLGHINKIGTIRPRMPVTYRELLRLPEHLRRYLASRDLGYLIISTSQGVMTHKDAMQKHLGGILIAYVY